MSDSYGFFGLPVLRALGLPCLVSSACRACNIPTSLTVKPLNASPVLAVRLPVAFDTPLYSFSQKVVQNPVLLVSLSAIWHRLQLRITSDVNIMDCVLPTE